MKVLRGDPLRWGPLPPRRSAITIGVFDGVHRGHQRVLAEVTERAAAQGLTSVALTFDVHPLELVAPDRAPRLLTTVEQRLELFEGTQLDVAGVLPFAGVRSMEPGVFIEGVLVASLGARLVAVGSDFRFGHDRAGDVGVLRAVGERLGYDVDEVELLAEGDGPLSSTSIRRLLMEGDVSGAAEALGRPYELRGRVVVGDGRGRSIGVPTANLEISHRVLIPGDGVYAAWAATNGGVHPAAVNIGVRPTFGGDTQTVEAHLIDVGTALDLYGSRLRLHFIDRIRGERRFAGPDELVTQIGHDVAAVRRLLAVGRRP
jgi:riboflavin kinase/FMN adenylyltransferase